MTAEEVGQQLQKAGCAGMSTGCLLTLLSPFIIIALLIALPLAVSAAPIVLSLLALAAPGIIIERRQYKHILSGLPDDDETPKAELRKLARKRSWKPTLKVYCIILATLAVLAAIGSQLPDSEPTSAAEWSPGANTSGAVQSASEADLGTWGVTYQGVRITTTIYRNDSSYRMEQVLVWNGNGDTIRERLSKRGDRYYLPGGEWFIIDTGYLDLYDSNGLIWTARPVQ